MFDFKAMVEADCKQVFTNANEFADIHDVKYDGVVYERIPVVLSMVKEMQRAAPSSDNMQGVHLVTATAHIALSDLNGHIPEQKRRISIDDGEALGAPHFVKYKIITSDCEMGMIILELEACDE